MKFADMLTKVIDNHIAFFVLQLLHYNLFYNRLFPESDLFLCAVKNRFKTVASRLGTRRVWSSLFWGRVRVSLFLQARSELSRTYFWTEPSINFILPKYLHRPIFSGPHNPALVKIIYPSMTDPCRYRLNEACVNYVSEKPYIFELHLLNIHR